MKSSSGLIAAICGFLSLLLGQEAKGGGCNPGGVIAGELQTGSLCYDVRSRTLDTIRYDIVQIDATIDLVPTVTLANKLASASQIAISHDQNDPNFIVLLIASNAIVNLQEQFKSLRIAKPAEGAKSFEKDIRDFKTSISSNVMDFGIVQELLRKENGLPVYVVVVVRKMPANATFFAIDVQDRMMRALGLTYANR